MSPLLFALVMNPLNRTVSRLLKGIDTDDELIKLKMLLMADDVIATVNDETDAAIFHSLISQFEKLSNLKLNPMKSVAYGTPGAKNRVPSIINIRQIILSAVNQDFEGFSWLFFLLHYDFGTWISSQIKNKVVMTLSTSSPQTAFLVESWFGLTTRNDFHPDIPAPITKFFITYLHPDAELISHVQHKHTGSPIQPTSFNSTSKTFYESNWKDHIITPSRARDNNITNWKQFRSKFSNFVSKNPGSYSTFHRFQTGHLYHQLNMNQKETCCFCNQSDFKNSDDHILDVCIITDRI
ncbi:unnamed protein product [Ambrosiozyma monospora]|uniref:Unnamed protein product n=1 Tax=Ambrosiozyma monospora TaxID=43982 RepID=A0ACB5SR36_AMBMO|nr:unnamed protein product [Ambrosiozyma monospora]